MLLRKKRFENRWNLELFLFLNNVSVRYPFRIELANPDVTLWLNLAHTLLALVKLILQYVYLTSDIIR